MRLLYLCTSRSVRPLIILSLTLSIILSGCQSAINGLEDQPTPTHRATSAPTKPATMVPTPTTAIVLTPTPLALVGGKTLENGLQFVDLVVGSGETPKTGDLVVMNYRATLPDGTEILNSSSGSTPRSVQMGEEQLLPGWEQGLTMMKAGGKARMILPPVLAFGSTPPSNVPANSSIVLEVELLKVMPVPQAANVDIKAFKKNPSGLLFYDLVVGTGRVALNSTFVTTRYVMWKKGLMDNTYLSSSESDTPVFFQVGKSSTVIAGWNEGVIGMKVGGKRQLLIAPDLAYGSTGSSTVPPDTTLVMEIELVDVKEPIKQTPIDEFNYTTTASGMRIYEIQTGVGDNPKPGQTVVVNYSAWLLDGTQFDSSYFRGQPFEFKLGAGQVIPGWEEGIAGMKVGGKRKLVIPPELAYGDTGAGNAIPAKATLVFEVELLEIRP